MKHQNPYFNVTLEEARKVQSFLNSVSFNVTDIVCNPNPTGQGGVNMVPEINLPTDGCEYALMFVFDTVREPFFVAQIRDLVQAPSIAALRTLHKTVWPSGAQSDLDARLMRVGAVQNAAQEAVNVLAVETGIVEPPKTPEPPEPVQEPSAATKRTAKKTVKKTAKKRAVKKASKR